MYKMQGRSAVPICSLARFELGFEVPFPLLPGCCCKVNLGLWLGLELIHVTMGSLLAERVENGQAPPVSSYYGS